MPDRAIVAGEFVALMPTVTLPKTEPVAAGVNVTFKIALWPEFKIVPAEMPLAPKPGPEMLVLEIVMLDLVEFVKVSPRVVLLPTITLPKFKMDELSISGCVPCVAETMPVHPELTTTINRRE